MVGSSLAYKYLTRVEVNDWGKHSRLLQYGNNYDRKKFCSKFPRTVLLDFLQP
jgi:hypothetical protein